MKITPKTRYLSLIVIFLLIIATSIMYIHDRLGGNDPLETYEIEGARKTIIGQDFVGRQTSAQIEEYFLEAKDLLRENRLTGELTIVSYKSDTLAGNEVHFFIGVSIDTDMAEIPDGFEVRKYRTGKRLAVFLSMHPIVRPAPRKIEKKLTLYAAQNDIKLKNFFMEVHYPDNSMKVEAWTE